MMSIAGNTKIIKSIFHQLPKQVCNLSEFYLFLCVKQLFYLKSRMSLDYSSIHMSSTLNTSPVLCLMDQFDAHFGSFTGTTEPMVLDTNEFELFISEFKKFPFERLSKYYTRSDRENTVRVPCTEFAEYKHQYIFMIADLLVYNYTENEDLKYLFCMPEGSDVLKLRQINLTDIYILGDYGLTLIRSLVGFDLPYFDFMEAQMLEANESYARSYDYTIQPGQNYFVYSDQFKYLTVFKNYSFHKLTFEVLQFSEEGAILRYDLVLTEAEFRKFKIVPVSFIFGIETEGGVVDLQGYLTDGKKKVKKER